MRTYDKQEDDTFFKDTLRDIAFFHQLYAKYKEPRWLDMARELNTVCARTRERLTSYMYEGANGLQKEAKDDNVSA